MSERSAWDDDRKVLWLRQAIARLVETKGPEFAREIEEIIFKRHSKRLFDKFLARNKNNTPEDFVNRVAGYFEELHVEVEALAILPLEKKAWDSIYITLQKKAYCRLRKMGFRPGRDTQTYAQECAQEAVLQLSKSHFHYLSSFESWVIILVRNVCYKQVEKDTKDKNSLFLEDEISVNSPESVSSEVEHHLLLEQLLKALARLTDEELQFIRWRYLAPPPLTFAQIAMKTGKHPSTVYRLFNAILEKLRKSLDG